MMDGDLIIPRPDSEYVLPTNVIRVGYLFDGWYLDSDLTTKVEKLTGAESGDINLYAKFIHYAEAEIVNKDTAALPNPQLNGLKGI
ncbi:MAG: InlB B-repeat-containing protein, partial [Clostridia bacterium]|nr:InlB B-repeat-containing protein [Clostridia bacterium]